MVYDGSRTVTTAGTRVTLVSTRTPAAWVIVQANHDNTDAVYVGGSTVSSTRGARLLAGDSVTIPQMAGVGAYDLQTVYVDAAVGGEGVRYIYGRP